MKRVPLHTLSLAILAVVLLAGCGSEKYGLSQHVTFLWQQHPSPWSEAAARAAAEDAKGLLASNPNDIQLHMYYQDRMGRLDQEAMVEEYEAKLAKDTTDARAILLEARAAGGRNRFAAQMKKAVEFAPRDPYVLAATAIGLLNSSPIEPELAMTYARQSVEIAPDLSLAHEALAKALFEQEEYEAALREADIAGEQNPYSFDPVYVSMKTLEMMDMEEVALQRLEAFADTQPLHSAVLYFLERAYRERGELEKIVLRKKLAAEASGEDGYAWLDLASTYHELGWTDSVMSALNSAINANFFDLEYTKTMFEEEQLASLATNREWQRIQQRMKQMRIDTRDERRTEALKERLDEPAPAFTATTLQGKEVSLADMSGKAVVLDFWATWCGPCRMTIPRLQEFNKAGAGGAQLISMDVWERMPADQRPSYVSDFARNEGMVWNVWLAQNETAEAYGVTGIPTFVVIDKEGIIRYKTVGYQPFLDEILGWMVEDANSKPL